MSVDVDIDSLTLPGKWLGKGGQGTVWRVQGPREYRGCCFKEPATSSLTSSELSRLRYQIAHPPADIEQPRFRLAWPTHVVVRQKRPIGFLMPEGFAASVRLDDLTRPHIDADLGPSFQKFDYSKSSAVTARLRASLNICAALQMLYSGGEYNVIDLKPENILITEKGAITLIDMDSVQIREKGAIIHDGPVATDGYKPPEAMQGYPDDTIRDNCWDNFALAVTLYQVMVGAHPYAGTFTAPFDQKFELGDKVAAGLFVFGEHSSSVKVRGAIHDTFLKLPAEMQQLFQRAFVGDPKLRKTRPSVTEWGDCLHSVISKLENRTLSINIAKRTPPSRPAPAPRGGLHNLPAAGAVPQPTPPTVPLGKILFWSGLGVFAIWIVSQIGSLFSGTSVLPISFTSVKFVQSIENGQPVGPSANFIAPASPSIYATYTNGRVGLDVVSEKLWNGSNLISSCNAITIQYQNGNVSCPVSAAPLDAGNYDEQILVNNQIVGSYPFTVESAAPITPSAPPARACFGPANSALVVICQNPDLTDLNNQVLALQSNLDRATGTPGALNQSSWQTGAAERCKLEASEADCLRSALQARYQALQSALAGPTQDQSKGTTTAIVTLSPDSTKDIWTTSVYSYAPDRRYPGGGLDNDQLRIGGWGDWYWSLMQFDLSSLPKQADRVILELYNEGTNAAPTPFDVFVIDQNWAWTKGDRLWWSDRPVQMHKALSIGAPSSNAWVSIDITDVYNAWQAGQTQNFGIALIPQLNNNNFDQFRSSKYADRSYRPRLVITAAQPANSIPVQTESVPTPAIDGQSVTKNADGDWDVVNHQ